MTLEVREVDPEQQVKTIVTRPLIIKWKQVPMVRGHSLRAAVSEMLQVMDRLDVVKIGIVGDQATGKSTLEDTLGHLIHKMASIPFAVRSFGRDEFLNMEKTLASLEPANYVLKFRDLSFLSAIATKKQIDVVKQIITVIRHLRQDVKIFLIYDYHYTLGLDKYLRQANFRFFTSVGSSEEDNLLKIVGTKYAHKITQFKSHFVKMVSQGKCSFQFKRGMPPFDYSYKNPFVLCMFWNEQRLRYVIFPRREWIDKICHVCSMGEDLESEVDLEKFIQESEHKLGDKTFEAAVKLKAFSNGMNVYSPNVVNALKYLDRALDKRQIPFEKILVHYGLDITKTRLRKQLDGVLLEEPKKLENNEDSNEKMEG